MERNYLLKDTLQIKRMKKHSLLWVYGCSGEIYKLLSLEVLHNLAKKIEKGTLELKSDLLYGRTIITYEENFISILDKYIGYVRDNYNINHNELVIILEQTLKNVYSRCFFIKSDYHEMPELFIKSFKQVFLANLVYNTTFYTKKDIGKNYHALQRANMFLETKKLNEHKDLEEIEKFFKKVINNRKSNLYNLFVPHGEIDKKQLDFYIHQVDWIYDDYYKKNDSIFKE